MRDDAVLALIRIALNCSQARYYRRYDELLPDNNHIVLVVVFHTWLNEHGQYVPNNFVVTGWANYIWSQR